MRLLISVLVALAMSGPFGMRAFAQVSQTPPKLMHWCAQHCSTWVWLGDRYVGEGTVHPERTPQCGVIVERFTPELVVMHRTDCTPYPGKAVLTGKLSSDGNSIINGIIRWTYHPCCGLSSGNFKAAWGNAIATVPGSDEERALAEQRSAQQETATQSSAQIPAPSNQVGICTSPPIRVAMQTVEDRAIHDPNGAALTMLGALVTGLNASSGRPIVIDSKIGTDGGRYTSKDPGSFVCRGLFLRGQVRVEELPDADAAADVAARAIDGLTKAYPSFIEWFKVKPSQDGSYILTLLPSAIQLSKEYSTEFLYLGSGVGSSTAMNCGPDKNEASSPKLESQFGVTPSGQDSAALLRAHQLLGAGDYGEALRLYRAAAEAGNPMAMRRTGALLELGHGVSQNYSEAMRWYRQAQAGGDAISMVNIGRLYDRGRGVSQNFNEAMNWYRKAANAGESSGMLNIGMIYSSGDGVARDYNEAYRWFQKAAAAGDPRAMSNIGAFYEKGLAVHQDFAQAMTWYRKAAASEPRAMTNVGSLYENGLGVPKNLGQAVCWYSRATAADDSLAMTYLGNLYLEGRGLPLSRREAMKLFQKAAQLGQPLAMNNIGVMYENGTGVPRNRDEAVRWYRQAAALGDEIAKKNLTRLGETLQP